MVGALKSVRSAKKGPRARGVREEPGVRRQAIVEATMRCIAEYGYAATTIDRICEEADISRGLINHHFSSKDELIAQTYKQLAEDLKAETRRAVQASEGGAEARLRAIVRVSFQAPIFDERTLAVWLGFWSVVRTSEVLRGMHRELYASYRRALAGILEAMARERGVAIDAPRAALTLTALIDGLWLEWCLDPQAFSPEAAEAACLAVLEGLFR